MSRRGHFIAQDIGKSWKVTANSSSIALPATSSLNLTDVFTIEGWLNIDASANTGTKVVFSKAGAQYQYQADLSASGTSFRFYVVAGAGNTFYSVTKTVTTGGWIWFAARCNVTAGKLSLCIGSSSNEALRTDLVGPHFTTTNAGTINNSSNSTIGYYDDWRYWSTYRTNAELDANRDTRLTGLESGLVAYYKLDNDATNSCVATGSANNATRTGGAYDDNIAPIF